MNSQNLEEITSQCLNPQYLLDTQQIPSISIAKILPANNILSKQYHKTDPKIKWKIITSSPQSQPLQSNNSKTLREQIEDRTVFTGEQGLGYQYQGLFHRHIAYGRIMNGLSFEKWERTMKFQPKHLEASKNMQNKVRYLSGIFEQNPTLFTSLDNNLPFLDAQEHNYMSQRLSFTASFCSANLLLAFQKKESQFDLIMHSDTNSKGSTQWFNFKVSLKKKGYYKFNIVNFTKSSSLYQKGMGVVVTYEDGTYHKVKIDLAYECNQIEIEKQNSIRRYYKTLTFTYICNKEETVNFSYGHPYAIQDMKRFDSSILKRVHKINKDSSLGAKIKVTKQQIGKTITGIPIQALILKQDIKPSLMKSKMLFETTKKKALVFLARQHPGQTQSSFIVQGIINFLLENPSYILHGDYIFYFIPMINMEGVLYGNYRTNFSGIDLNRKWRNSNKNYEPEVCAIKSYLQSIDQVNPIALILDLHGHSKSFNSFFYGVYRPSLKHNSKLFPYFCSKRSNKFSYEQSNFEVPENKKNTARVVLAQLFPHSLVYTVENSFYGYKVGDKIIEYRPDELKKVGSQLITLYFDYQRANKTMKKQEISKMQSEVECYQKRMCKDSKNKESYDSDSQAQLQLDEQKTYSDEEIIVLPKTQNISNKENTIEYSRNKISTLRHNRNLSKKGFFMKNIQVIDANGKQSSEVSQCISTQKTIKVQEPKRRQGIQRVLRPAFYLKNKGKPFTTEKINKVPNIFNQSSNLISVNSIKLQFTKVPINKASGQEKVSPRKNQRNPNFLTFVNEREYQTQNNKRLRNKRIETVGYTKQNEEKLD